MNKKKSKVPLSQMVKNTLDLLRFAWQMDRKLVASYYFISVVNAFFPLATAYALTLLIDNLQLVQGSIEPTVPVIIIVILAVRYIVDLTETLLIQLHRSYLRAVFDMKISQEIEYQFYKKLSKLDVVHLETPETHDLMTKTQDTMKGRLPEYLHTFSGLLINGIGYIAAFIVIMPFSWWMPIVLTIVTVPGLYLQSRQFAIRWTAWESGAQKRKESSYLQSIMREATTIKETRVSQSSSFLLTKLKNIQQHLFVLNKKPLDKYILIISIAPIIESATIFALAYQFLGPVTSGVMTIGSFSLLISMLQQLGYRSANISDSLAQIYENNFYIKYYFDFLALPCLVPVANNPIKLKGDKPPKIEFRDVSFGYPDGGKVLDNVSFVIEPGQNVAFVGSNGAGKTTIVKLLCRFYDVDSGEILINDINIKDLDLSSWYDFLNTLFQDFIKYHFTVRENIMLGAPDKKDEAAMKAAAIKSGAASFIDRLPNKYDQILGKEFEGGEELSGGQWQKLAIARAFYGAAPVLMLDEPTSAVDVETEEEIFNSLEDQYKDNTLILVSHRFSTVRKADKIIVIDQGRVIESGSHEELIKLEGKYSKLFSSQAKGYK